MALRPTRLLTLAAFLLLGALPLQATGLVDPLLRFKQVRTAHFIIYFHDGEEPLAARLATVVEDIRTRVGAALALTPPPLTHVIVADQSEVANGWATPLPRDVVFLNAAVPAGVDMIGNTDDWLRLVFTHEYTHIVHLDRSGGWAWLVRGIFGRTPIAFPNLYLPEWQVEGLATWEESALTGRGRARAGDFRAIQSTAAAAGRSLSLDRASGGLVRWPGGHAAYAAGLGFHEYLAERFGAETFGALATRTSRRLPFLGMRAFKGVYGESLGALWRDYTTHLAADVAGAPTGPIGARRLTAHGHVVLAPRMAPASCDECPDTVIYSLQGPHEFPSLRAVALDGTGDRALTTRYLGSTVGLSTTRILFDQQEVRRNVGVYSDLYSYDRATGDVRPVTHESRLQDPDLAPDGMHVAAVRERSGRRDLIVLTLAAPAPAAASNSLRVLASEPETQFSTPRWSPDGRFIVAERRRLGMLPDVVIVNAQTGDIEQTISLPGSRIVTPTWRPDARAIVAAADVGGLPFELYEFPLEGDAVGRALTRSAGATWPDVSADGRTLVFAGYTPDGYDLFTLPYAPLADAMVMFSRDAAAAGVADRSADGRPRDARAYSPLPTLSPTSWTPLVTVSADQTRLGAAVTGSDLLGRHAYAAGATWLVSGIDAVRPLPSRVPDWSAVYVYSRWRPSVFASVSRDSLFRDVVDTVSMRTSTVAAVQHEVEAGVFVPISHVRSRAQLLASIVRTDTRYRLPDEGRRVSLVSSRAAAAYDTSRLYGYSISREDGVSAGTTIELTRRALGSRADATTSTVDVRAYIPGMRRHHVLALRAAGGLSRGEDLARQAFVVGSVAASPSLVDFGADALGLVRDGLSETAGDRVLVVNGEYRLPLANIERGIGTWPLLVRTLHASVFADAARVRGVQPDRGWRRAFGAELGISGVAGYALPFDAAVGAAWGGDGNGRSGTSVYARLGHAF